MPEGRRLSVPALIYEADACRLSMTAYDAAALIRQDRASSHPGLAHLDHRTQRLARRHAPAAAPSRTVSAQLKRLRALTGDPLLVRAGNGMAPTETALQLLGAGGPLLHEAEPPVRRPGQRSAASRPVPARSPSASPPATTSTRCSCPSSSRSSSSWRRRCALELLPLSGEFDYRRSLAAGEVDLVIGNWLEPPGELHLGRLMSDEIVCLVADDHPACARARLDGRALPGLRARRADAAARPVRRGVIDEHLAALGPGARRRRAQRALQPDPADGGAEPAGADDRAPVLLALCRRAAGAHRALPGRRFRR